MKYTYLKHEALHMASFLGGAVETHLLEHEAVKANEEWKALAESAAQSLSDLYQAIGAEMAYSEESE